MSDIQDDQQLCEGCGHTWNQHKPLGQFSRKNNETCLVKDCDCLWFGMPNDPDRLTSIARIPGMTNAQAALIAAAMSVPRGTHIYEIRGRAAEFAWMLDSVDKQNQPGGPGSRTWPHT